MNGYTEQQMTEALEVVTSTIINCEKQQPKFSEGTSQHTLLKNRIRALYISKALIQGESTVDNYTKEELSAALPPVISIIKKCEKGQGKFSQGTPHYNRFEKIIRAMYIAKEMISDEINRRD